MPWTPLMPVTIKGQIEEELYVTTCSVFTAYTKPMALTEIYGLMTSLSSLLSTEGSN